MCAREAGEKEILSIAQDSGSTLMRGGGWVKAETIAKERHARYCSGHQSIHVSIRSDYRGLHSSVGLIVSHICGALGTVAFWARREKRPRYS